MAALREQGKVRFTETILGGRLADDEVSGESNEPSGSKHDRRHRLDDRRKTGKEGALTETTTLLEETKLESSGEEASTAVASRTPTFAVAAPTADIQNIAERIQTPYYPRDCNLRHEQGGEEGSRCRAVRFGTSSFDLSDEEGEVGGNKFHDPDRSKQRFTRIACRRKTGPPAKLTTDQLSDLQRRMSSERSDDEDDAGGGDNSGCTESSGYRAGSRVGGGRPTKDRSVAICEQATANVGGQDEAVFFSPTRRGERHQGVSQRGKIGKGQVKDSALDELRRLSLERGLTSGDGDTGVGLCQAVLRRCEGVAVGTENKVGNGNGARVGSGGAVDVEAKREVGVDVGVAAVEKGRAVRFGNSSFELSDDEAEAAGDKFHDPVRSKQRFTRIACRRKTGPPAKLTTDQLADLQRRTSDAPEERDEAIGATPTEAEFGGVRFADEKEDGGRLQSTVNEGGETEDYYSPSRRQERQQRLKERRKTGNAKLSEDQLEELRALSLEPSDGDMRNGGGGNGDIVAGAVTTAEDADVKMRSVRFGCSSFELSDVESEGESGQKFNDPARSQQRFARICGRRKTGPKNLTAEQVQLLTRMRPGQDEHNVEEELCPVTAVTAASYGSTRSCSTRSPKKSGGVRFAETAASNVEEKEEAYYSPGGRGEDIYQGASEVGETDNVKLMNEAQPKLQGLRSLSFHSAEDLEEVSPTAVYHASERKASERVPTPYPRAAKTGTVKTGEREEEEEGLKMRSVRFGSSSFDLSDVDDETTGEAGQKFNDPDRRQQRFTRISSRRKTGPSNLTADQIATLTGISTADVAESSEVLQLTAPAKKAAGVRFAAACVSVDGEEEEEYFSMCSREESGARVGGNGKAERPKHKDEERRLSSVTNVSTDAGGPAEGARPRSLGRGGGGSVLRPPVVSDGESCPNDRSVSRVRCSRNGQDAFGEVGSSRVMRSVRFGSSSFELSDQEGDEEEGKKFNDPSRSQQRFTRISSRRKTGPSNLTADQLAALVSLSSELAESDRDTAGVAADGGDRSSGNLSGAAAVDAVGEDLNGASVHRDTAECQRLAERRKREYAADSSGNEAPVALRKVSERRPTPYPRQGSGGEDSNVGGLAANGAEEEEEAGVTRRRSVQFGSSSFEISDHEEENTQKFNDPDRVKQRFARISSRRKTGPSTLTAEQLMSLRSLSLDLADCVDSDDGMDG
eukprot:GHVS01057842.1.p1 GENE.GHVS01057842.1~~GHVS01057842.1.p1  ORF type:complete len:1197 (+),score=253.85 GHVS01057842.1:224-3814(+)